MKKKKNTYQFLNIIEKEKFDNFTQDEKEKFLLDAKIYIRQPQSVLNQPAFTYPDENGEILLDHFFSANYLNDLVRSEMVIWFEEVGSDFKPEFEGYKETFEVIINRALDNSDKERIIRNEYEKISSILHNCLLGDSSFTGNYAEKDMYDCVASWSIDEDVVFEYITEERPFLRSRTPFEECDEVKYNLEILKFLKEEMNNITGSNQEKVYIPRSTTPLPFNDKIFRTIESQQWFHDTLKSMGALEEDNTPKKRKFQPICHAIYYSDDCKKKIFRYNLELKDFILFLNNEFKTNINSKLSTGYRHVGEVEELLLKIV